MVSASRPIGVVGLIGLGSSFRGRRLFLRTTKANHALQR